MQNCPPSFDYGLLNPRWDGHQKRDESGVASHQLVALLKEIGGFQTAQELADRSGVNPRILARIFGTMHQAPDQPWTALVTADRLLTALGCDWRIHELPAIPNALRNDALAMARYEFIDCDGEVEIMTATEEEIEARADELEALRQELIGAELLRLEPARALQAKKDKVRRDAREARLAATA